MGGQVGVFDGFVYGGFRGFSGVFEGIKAPGVKWP